RLASMVADVYSRQDRRSKIQAFIGPTGVGKTTTLAKLATRMALFEQKKIALIAIYSHRFGVVEELKFYGQMIGVPVEVVMTPAELASAVEAHQDKDAVFIDTEGISCRNAGQLLKLKGFMDALPPSRRTFLVLSATTRNRDLLHMAREFARAGYSEFIFTKLDETRTRGGALNLIHQMHLPLAYVTSGQNVPDDIAGVNPRSLAALILEGGESDVGAGFQD
ncbi:MAG: flagellar biosynthesis protein FlhF, partial [Desulfofundulus sp.]